MSVHPTAIIEDGAAVADEVDVGAYCRIGPKVVLSKGVKLLSHVSIDGHTEIGAGTVIHPFAVLGGPPQHLGYKGENTKLFIGANNIIREHVTMNIGTPDGRGETRIGDNGMFMTACHVAHDCVIGDNVIFANNATLGGHVSIGSNAFLGGLSAIHQFCRVGENAFIGGCAAAPTDVIPYGSATGNHANLSGLNIVGMKRRGLDRKSIHALRGAYRVLFKDQGTFQERVDEVEKNYGAADEVMKIVRFIRADARRPIMTPGS